MVSSPDSLGAEYKQHLRSLNHRLPQVIEHLVEVNILSQAEATRVVSASNQFGRLCQQLVSKGHERKALIFSEIESFRRRNFEQTGADVVDRYLEETPLEQHHKHVYDIGGAHVSVIEEIMSVPLPPNVTIICQQNDTYYIGQCLCC